MDKAETADRSDVARIESEEVDHHMQQDHVWELDEKIMCKCEKTKLFYEAKIVNVVRNGDNLAYKVHYYGWNTAFDEEILQEDTSKRFQIWTEENKQKALALSNQGKLKPVSNKSNPLTPDSANNKKNSKGGVSSRKTPIITRNMVNGNASNTPNNVKSSRSSGTFTPEGIDDEKQIEKGSRRRSVVKAVAVKPDSVQSTKKKAKSGAQAAVNLFATTPKKRKLNERPVDADKSQEFHKVSDMEVPAKRSAKLAANEKSAIDDARPAIAFDGVVLVQNERIKVNKGLLSVYSGYFNGLFLLNQEQNVEIKDVLVAEFRHLLAVIYPSRNHDEITDSNVECLLRLAKKFDIKNVAERCEDFLKDTSKGFSLTKKLGLAHEYALASLKDSCVKQVCTWDELKKLKESEEYATLDKDLKCQLLDNVR